MQVFHTKEEIKQVLEKKLGFAEKNLAIKIDNFLRTNTRVDRDKVIMKREEIKTIKYINELF